MNELQALAGTEVSVVAHTIQVAVAPVFLLAGIGGFLNVCAIRLARVIDRARWVEMTITRSTGKEHDRLIDEIRILDRRISVVNSAIFLSVLAAILISGVVILLFAASLFQVNVGMLISLCFVGSMVSVAMAFAIFLYETRLGSRVTHIRNEILYHQAEAVQQNEGPKLSRATPPDGDGTRP